MSDLGYCVVKYNGNAAGPEHLKKLFRFKGIEFSSGEEQEIRSDLAHQLLKHAPKGTVTLIKGTPTEPKLEGSTSAKQAIRDRARFEESLRFDPAKALADVKEVPEALRKLLSGKDGVAAVEKGEADAQLIDVALWATFHGLEDVAKAAARRAHKQLTTPE